MSEFEDCFRKWQKTCEAYHELKNRRLTMETKVNIAAKMKSVLPELNEGLNGIRFHLKPECEEGWNENYAIVNGLYYDYPSDLGMPGGDYFDSDQFRYDFEQLVKSHFPNSTVTFYWQSQEIEVSKK